MKILGISAHYHDAAAALVVDGVPVCAVQEERLSRRKSDAAFPLCAIEWCLDHAGIEPEALDAVVFYERPMLKFERILTCALRAFPRSWRMFPKAMKNSLGEKVWVRGIISSHLGVPGRKVLFTEHHQSHAAAAFLTAPTRRAAILTTDGVGEWATLSVGHGERRPDGSTDITLLREIRFPHSLGMLYSTFTAYLGFKVNEDEYKVMGLAGYGQPSMIDDVRRSFAERPTALLSSTSTTSTSTLPPRDPIRRGSSISSVRRAILTIRSISRPTKAAGLPASPRACSASLKRCWSASRATFKPRQASPTFASAAAWRSTVWPMHASWPSRDSTASSFLPLPEMPDARSAPRFTPTAFTSEMPTATFPTIHSGDPR